jgi:hypothetical protein
VSTPFTPDEEALLRALDFPAPIDVIELGGRLPANDHGGDAVEIVRMLAQAAVELDHEAGAAICEPIDSLFGSPSSVDPWPSLPIMRTCVREVDVLVAPAVTQSHLSRPARR